MIRLQYLIAIVVIILTGAIDRVQAQSLEPRAYSHAPVGLNFLAPEIPKKTLNGGKIPGAYVRLDAFFGQVMDELKELGIAENTIFVAMADNGPMSHNPPPGWAMTEIMYRGGKGDFLEGGVRVPAIAWWPGVIEKGQLVGDIIDEYLEFNVPGSKEVGDWGG